MEMKILKLSELDKKNNVFIDKVCFEGKKNILLSSQDNGEGKTTILRAIIFCLGFDIKVISDGFDKTNPILKMEFLIGDKKHIWKRGLKESNIVYQLEPSIRMYDISKETDSEELAITLGFNNYNFMNDIIGAIYIDQEFGWRTTNHGDIYPNHSTRFNFPKIISKIIGNSQEEDDHLLKKMNKLKSNKKSILKLLEIQRLNGEKPFEDKEMQDISIRVAELSSKIWRIDNILSKKRKTQNEMAYFIKIINNNKVLNNLFSKEKKEMLKTIKDFEENLSENEIKQYTLIRERIIKEKKVLQDEIAKQQSSMSDNQLMPYIITKIPDLDTLNLKIKEMDEIINDIEKRRKKIRNKNESKFKEIFELIRKNIEAIMRTEINITSHQFMQLKSAAVFNKISGAKKGFMVIFTRIIILKMLFDEYGLKLPFFIDTIISFDPSDKSKEHLYKILGIMTKNASQLIIASVNKEVNTSLKKKLELEEIEVKGDFKKKEEGQISFDDFDYQA